MIMARKQHSDPGLAEASPISVAVAAPPNLDCHHGALRPVAGVQTFQVLRANRERPELADGYGWTYNHSPMLAYWRDRWLLSYLSNPKEEHVAPGHTLLATSEDGSAWSFPELLFPEYVLDKAANTKLADDPAVPDQAVMHQRMGFHLAANGRMLAMGFYGFCPRPDLVPFDSRGIGRVVREIRPDFSFGSIHFIRYNRHAGWGEGNTAFPFYKASDDAGFVEACEDALSNPLITQQWKEEHGDADELIPLKGSYKAFCYYTLPDGRVAGYWKWSLAGISSDRGRSWDWVGEIPDIENAGGKLWAQRASDGSYVLVYNPTTNNKHRWPLALARSEDGLSFEGLLRVEGEAPPRRYWGGAFKDFGMNYVRGIVEGNGAPPDGDIWVAYSMNKEDIWVSRIPVPTIAEEPSRCLEPLAALEPGKGARGWNVYAPKWAPVCAEADPDSPSPRLRLEDADPCDYARAERVFRPARRVEVRLQVMAQQEAGKPLYLELCDAGGQIPARIVFAEDGSILADHGRKRERLGSYVSGRWHRLVLSARIDRHRFQLELDCAPRAVDQVYQGERICSDGWFLRASVRSLERLVLRTGPVRREPHTDMTVFEGPTIPNSGRMLAPSVFLIRDVLIETLEDA